MKITAKKAGLVSAVSFAFLLVCSVVAYSLRFAPLSSAAVTLVIGLGILALGGALVLFAKKRIALNIPVFFLSAVALGFCIRSWYLFRGFDNSLTVMLAVCLCATAYLWVFYLFSKIPLFRDNPAAFVSLYLIISLAAYILTVIFTRTTYVSTFGYYMLIEITFIFAMYSEADNAGSVIHNLALSTFSVFGAAAFIAAIIALAVLGGDCDFDGECCECCECIDGCDGLDLKRKNKAKK